mmetsp:Transcript_35033/g.75589  ORF Transcript_35033/g.75589 Transcript_35033/m.75589 type:complete len:821 (+) Transcript_35033:80-2542(+)
MPAALDFLVDLPELRTLDLRCSNIQTGSALVLARTVAWLPKIHSLLLKGNPLGELGTRALLRLAVFPTPSQFDEKNRLKVILLEPELEDSVEARLATFSKPGTPLAALGDLSGTMNLNMEDAVARTSLSICLDRWADKAPQLAFSEAFLLPTLDGRPVNEGFRRDSKGRWDLPPTGMFSFTCLIPSEISGTRRQLVEAEERRLLQLAAVSGRSKSIFMLLSALSMDFKVSVGTARSLCTWLHQSGESTLAATAALRLLGGAWHHHQRSNSKSQFYDFPQENGGGAFEGEVPPDIPGRVSDSGTIYLENLAGDDKLQSGMNSRKSSSEDSDEDSDDEDSDDKDSDNTSSGKNQLQKQLPYPGIDVDLGDFSGNFGNFGPSGAPADFGKLGNFGDFGNFGSFGNLDSMDQVLSKTSLQGPDDEGAEFDFLNWLSYARTAGVTASMPLKEPKHMHACLDFLVPENPTARYLMNLSIPAERVAAEYILGINAWEVELGKQLLMPDVSKFGTYQLIRNEAIDSYPFIYRRDWPLLTAGVFQFDLSVPRRPKRTDKIITEFAWQKVLAVLSQSELPVALRVLCLRRASAVGLVVSCKQVQSALALLREEAAKQMGSLQDLRAGPDKKSSKKGKSKSKSRSPSPGSAAASPSGGSLMHSNLELALLSVLLFRVKDYANTEPALFGQALPQPKKGTKAPKSNGNTSDPHKEMLRGWCEDVFGRLNVACPTQLQHRKFVLDLSVHEDRQLCKLILFIIMKEGKGAIDPKLLSLCAYGPSVTELRPMIVPPEWWGKAGPPLAGIFAIRYAVDKDMPAVRRRAAKQYCGWE